MLIRFIMATDERIQGAAHNVGDVVDLPGPSAERWMRRGVAVAVSDNPGAKPKGSARRPVARKRRPKASEAEAAPAPAVDGRSSEAADE